jgi:hypothetical protein
MKLNDILKPEEIAEKFGLSEETVLNWREIGMPWIRLGKMVLISEKSFLRWLKGLEKAKNAQDAPGQDFFGKPIEDTMPPKS